MKQLLWNSVKWIWVIAASYGYVLYFTQKLSANLTIVWVSTASILLAGSYSFLSGYRLGPTEITGEFLPKSDISDINYNQWLFGAWVVLSLAIMIPAYDYRPAWLMVAPSLLVFGIIICLSIMTMFGKCCRFVDEILRDDFLEH